MPAGTATARAIDYSLNRWAALTRYLDDPRLPIDNNHDVAIRCVVPHAKMKTANIRNTQPNGTSGRRRTNVYSATGIE